MKKYTIEEFIAFHKEYLEYFSKTAFFHHDQLLNFENWLKQRVKPVDYVAISDKLEDEMGW